SPSVERLLGHDPLRCVGLGLFDFVHPDDRESMIAALADVDAHGSAGPLAVRVRHHAGGWRSLEAICSAFRSAEGERLWVLTARAVSARPRLDQPVAAGVVHELNNTLTAILGFAEATAREFPPGDDRGTSMREIIEAGERAAELTRQLLELGRVQATTHHL